MSTVVLPPILNYEHYKNIRELLYEHMANDDNELILDFQAVNYIDSSIIGLLVFLKNKYPNYQINLINKNDLIKKTFDVLCIGDSL